MDIPKDLYEFARGDNITLPCKFVPEGEASLVIITWTGNVDKGIAEEVRLLSLSETDYWLLFLIKWEMSHSSHF